jgi:hypothetical protein
VSWDCHSNVEYPGNLRQQINNVRILEKVCYFETPAVIAIRKIAVRLNFFVVLVLPLCVKFYPDQD